jgi:putative serine protease PepD
MTDERPTDDEQQQPAVAAPAGEQPAAQQPAAQQQWWSAPVDDPWAPRADDDTRHTAPIGPPIPPPEDAARPADDGWGGYGRSTGYSDQSGYGQGSSYGQGSPYAPGSPYGDSPTVSIPHDELWQSYLGQPRAPLPSERKTRERGRGIGVPLLVGLTVLAALLGGGIGAGATLMATDDDRAAVATPLPTPAAQPAGTTTIRETVPGSVAELASKLLPSVVEIGVTDELGRPAGTGSGVVISQDGYIITNNHVVAGGSKVEVSIGTKEIPATIVGTDPDNDLAVIKAATTGLTPAQIGSSAKLRVGDPVIAIGSPLGLSGTVTTGIISALNREVRVPGEAGGPGKTLFGAIQTDAAINPGNSGGALVNSAGQVIGINSAIATTGAALGGQSGSIGLGFAIPIDLANDVARQLIDTGKVVHPYIGVNVRTIDEDAARELQLPVGARIDNVQPDSPSDAAGLQIDDVITKINGAPVTTSEELVREIRKHKVGEKLTVTYSRSGTERTAELTLAEKPRN